MQYNAIHDYINFEDLLIKKQYYFYKPRMGQLGREILKASNQNKSLRWLKRYFDNHFRNIRKIINNKQKGR